MSKKYKGHNAFYYFMLDWKDRQRTPNRSLKEVAADPRCNEEWKSLAPTHKGRFEALARASKIQAQGSATKLTTTGESLLELEEQERQKVQWTENMKQYIYSVISLGMTHDNLQNMKFMFIHVNWFYQKQIGINKYQYGPAEFAVSEFSLEAGTENVYHEILKTELPIGYKDESMKRSSGMHQIPVSYEEGESDYSLMYSKLISLLEKNKSGNKLPPLFTTDNDMPVVHSLLSRMCTAADQSTDFDVYSIEELFYQMVNTAMKYTKEEGHLPLSVAIIEFHKDIFAYISGTECNFHKFIDNASQYCSQSIVTRWGFNFCDYCRKYMGLEMIEGVHCPVTRTLNDADHDVDEISARMEWLTAGTKKKKRTTTAKDLNGVSNNYRERVSERSYAEEQRRRVTSKPVEIIDHSKITEDPSTSEAAETEILPQRPLRRPKTLSSLFQISVDSTSPDYDLKYPSIGRGIRRDGDKDVARDFKSLGRGRNI